MLWTIVYILLNSISRPSILFLSPISLQPLAKLIPSIPTRYSTPGVLHWGGCMLVRFGSHCRFFHESSICSWLYCISYFCQYWVSWCLSRTEVSATSWRVPILFPMLGLGSVRTSSWLWWCFPLPPCHQSSYLRWFVLHQIPSFECLFPAHGILNIHIHGHCIWTYCIYDRTCMHMQSGYWRPAMYSGWSEFLPTDHRPFPIPYYWGWVGRKFSPIPPLGLW